MTATKRARSSVTGRFVTLAYAAAHHPTNVETITRKAKP